MNWNSSEFIWLDWAVLAVGVILIAWAVSDCMGSVSCNPKRQKATTRSQQ